MKWRYRVEEWNDGMVERLSELESENLMSRWWEGLWERIMMEDWEDGRSLQKGFQEGKLISN